MFRKVLVANRGEIAVRVMRACRALGIRTVAVYSEVDRAALHVRFADEAYAIGPAPSTESYLRMDRVLDVARHSGAEAINPGYGFLSENAAFAEICGSCGVTFIGPTVRNMRVMGDKARARRVADKVGVPTIPGDSRGLLDPAEALAIAERAGFPV